MKDSIKARGEWTVEAFDASGAPLWSQHYKNVVVQNFFTNVFKALKAEASVLNLTHIATGTGTAAASKSDTALRAEVFRKAITVKSYTANAFVCKLSLATSESAFGIKEIGVVINGSDTLGTGALLSRCNVDIQKNASTQLLLTYTLTME